MKHLHLPLWCVGLVLFFSADIFAQQDYQAQRKEMVNDMIMRRGFYHYATIKAMRKVPRHLFVPEEVRNMAYFDQPLPIGQGQTISQPYMVAYMTSVIKPKPGMKVLEIGTGSGYQAAVLAEIVDSVCTIEIIEELGEEAIQRFKELGYKNVYTKIGDGYLGWPELAPFDAIIVTAAPETIPPPLFEQLKEGGKMVIPVGPAYLAQELLLVEKKEGKMLTTHLFPVRFVPFTREFGER